MTLFFCWLYNLIDVHNLEKYFRSNDDFVSCEDGYWYWEECLKCGYKTTERYIDHHEPHYIEENLSIFDPDWKERVY